MATLLYIVGGLFWLGSLVCFIMVVVKMFQNGDTTMGIVCLVLIPCVGIGGLVAFVVGWMRAGAWNIQNIMTVWTVCMVGGIVLNTGATLMGGGL